MSALSISYFHKNFPSAAAIPTTVFAITATYCLTPSTSIGMHDAYAAPDRPGRPPSRSSRRSSCSAPPPPRPARPASQSPSRRQSAAIREVPHRRLGPEITRKRLLPDNLVIFQIHAEHIPAMPTMYSFPSSTAGVLDDPSDPGAWAAGAGPKPASTPPFRPLRSAP